jgi:hypothetical protein
VASLTTRLTQGKPTAQKEVNPRKIREVPRPKAAVLGLKVRQIAASTGAACTTVYENMVRAEAAGLSWRLSEGRDDEALEARLFPPATTRLAQRRRVAERRGAERREVHRELRRGNTSFCDCCGSSGRPPVTTKRRSPRFCQNKGGGPLLVRPSLSAACNCHP